MEGEDPYKGLTKEQIKRLKKKEKKKRQKQNKRQADQQPEEPEELPPSKEQHKRSRRNF